MIGAAGVVGAILGGGLSQLFGFRATMLGATIFSISGFLFYKTLGGAAGTRDN